MLKIVRAHVQFWQMLKLDHSIETIERSYPDSLENMLGK